MNRGGLVPPPPPSDSMFSTVFTGASQRASVHFSLRLRRVVSESRPIIRAYGTLCNSCHLTFVHLYERYHFPHIFYMNVTYSHAHARTPVHHNIFVTMSSVHVYLSVRGKEDQRLHLWAIILGPPTNPVRWFGPD